MLIYKSLTFDISNISCGIYLPITPQLKAVISGYDV